MFLSIICSDMYWHPSPSVAPENCFTYYSLYYAGSDASVGHGCDPSIRFLTLRVLGSSDKDPTLDSGTVTQHTSLNNWYCISYPTLHMTNFNIKSKRII